MMARVCGSKPDNTPVFTSIAVVFGCASQIGP